MEKKYKKGLAISASLAILAGAVFTISQWTSKQTESPHYVDLACAVCHFYMENTCTSFDCVQCHPLAGDSAYSVLKTDENTLCTACHTREGNIVVKNAEGVDIQVDLGKSHPNGITPSNNSMPQTLPLSMGRIVCSTCHDVHRSNDESNMLRLYNPQDTGHADFTPLCLDCHKDY